MSTPNSKNYGSGETQRAFSGLPQSFVIDIAVTANKDACIFLSTGGLPSSGNGYEVLMLCVLCLLVADSSIPFIADCARRLE